jgi:cell division protein FtsI/penicillin-binding protein 2
MDEPEAENAEDEGAEAFVLPGGEQPPFAARLQPLPAGQDLLGRATLEDGRYWIDGPQGRRALTVDAELQRQMTRLLETYTVPFGAIAAVEPSTGRVLALAEHSREMPEMRGLAVKALYPAASVFKIVTGAALLSAGVSAEERVCYHGGKRRLNEKHLKDDPRRDRACTTLSEAMGNSTNVVFAKLASRRLDAATLSRWSEKFRFNAGWSASLPLEPSPASIPTDTFGMASTAAGFGEVFLSPLHGALLAGTVGNRGRMVGPRIFEDEVPFERQVLSEELAGTLGQMLEKTVTSGTARRAFRERGRYVLGEVEAAGKTGSLADKAPFRDYSWFVGWAPRENPTIAVAAVVVNNPLWRVRAPYLGREALRVYLEAHSSKVVHKDGKGSGKPTRSGRSARRR